MTRRTGALMPMVTYTCRSRLPKPFGVRSGRFEGSLKVSTHHSNVSYILSTGAALQL